MLRSLIAWDKPPSTAHAALRTGTVIDAVRRTQRRYILDIDGSVLLAVVNTAKSQERFRRARNLVCRPIHIRTARNDSSGGL